MTWGTPAIVAEVEAYTAAIVAARDDYRRHPTRFDGNNTCPTCAGPKRSWKANLCHQCEQRAAREAAKTNPATAGRTIPTQPRKARP